MWWLNRGNFFTCHKGKDSRLDGLRQALTIISTRGNHISATAACDKILSTPCLSTMLLSLRSHARNLAPSNQGLRAFATFAPLPNPSSTPVRCFHRHVSIALSDGVNAPECGVARALSHLGFWVIVVIGLNDASQLALYLKFAEEIWASACRGTR